MSVAVPRRYRLKGTAPAKKAKGTEKASVSLAVVSSGNIVPSLATAASVSSSSNSSCSGADSVQTSMVLPVVPKRNKPSAEAKVKNDPLVDTLTAQFSASLSLTEPVPKPTLPSVDKAERVKRLREHLALSEVHHEEEVMKLATLKEAHTYCVIHGVSAQKYGPLLERFIRTKFNYIKNKATECTGDCSKDGKNSEVKVSLGGASHTKFNFVQIRPSHDCETYILTAYNLSSDNVESEGELYIFKVPKEDIKKIVVSFGGYAHGTIKEHSKITIESLNDKKSTKEYALRPTINDACWKALMPFKVPESAL
jgi:hypothetical protein